MKIEIINNPFYAIIFGFSGTANNKNYADTGFKLMDKMWQLINENNLKHKGINFWVYEPNEAMFAGVELNEIPTIETGLQQKNIELTKYAYYKHIGPYHQLGKVAENILSELKNNGIEISLPYIEKYGHWTGDENTSETEILVGIK